MKNIDIKSLIIGALLTSTIILGVGATSKADAGKWDFKQMWDIRTTPLGREIDRSTISWEPFAISHEGQILWRKRIK